MSKYITHYATKKIQYKVRL